MPRNNKRNRNRGQAHTPNKSKSTTPRDESPHPTSAAVAVKEVVEEVSLSEVKEDVIQAQDKTIQPTTEKDDKPTPEEKQNDVQIESHPLDENASKSTDLDMQTVKKKRNRNRNRNKNHSNTTESDNNSTADTKENSPTIPAADVAKAVASVVDAKIEENPTENIVEPPAIEEVNSTTKDANVIKSDENAPEIISQDNGENANVENEKKEIEPSMSANVEIDIENDIEQPIVEIKEPIQKEEEKVVELEPVTAAKTENDAKGAKDAKKLSPKTNKKQNKKANVPAKPGEGKLKTDPPKAAKTEIVEKTETAGEVLGAALENIKEDKKEKLEVTAEKKELAPVQIEPTAEEASTESKSDSKSDEEKATGEVLAEEPKLLIEVDSSKSETITVEPEQENKNVSPPKTPSPKESKKSKNKKNPNQNLHSVQQPAQPPKEQKIVQVVTTEKKETELSVKEIVADEPIPPSDDKAAEESTEVVDIGKTIEEIPKPNDQTMGATPKLDFSAAVKETAISTENTAKKEEVAKIEPKKESKQSVKVGKEMDGTADIWKVLEEAKRRDSPVEIKVEEIIVEKPVKAEPKILSVQMPIVSQQDEKKMSEATVSLMTLLDSAPPDGNSTTSKPKKSKENEKSVSTKEEKSTSPKLETVTPKKAEKSAVKKEGSTSPVKEQTPSPKKAKEEKSPPPKDEKSSPKKEKKSSPMKERKPSSVKEEKPAPAKLEKSSPPKEEKVAAAKVEKSSPPKEQMPSPKKEGKISPSKEKNSSPEIVEEPAPAVIKEVISPSTEEKQSPVKEEESILSTEKTSSPVKETEPPPVKEKKTSPIKETPSDKKAIDTQPTKKPEPKKKESKAPQKNAKNGKSTPKQPSPKPEKPPAQESVPPEPNIEESLSSIETIEPEIDLLHLPTPSVDTTNELLDTDQKNVQGSDFVPSVELKVSSSAEAKSLDNGTSLKTEMQTKKESKEKVKSKSPSPATNKLIKNKTNSKQCVKPTNGEGTDARNSNGEKISAAAKPKSQVTNVALVDILDVKINEPNATAPIANGSDKNKTETANNLIEHKSAKADDAVAENKLNENKPKNEAEGKRVDTINKEAIVVALPELKSSQQSNDKPIVPPKPDHLVSSKPKKPTTPNDEDESIETVIKIVSAGGANDGDESEEDYIEYKFMPRQVFISTICQTCKTPTVSSERILCPQCQMVSYCSADDLNENEPNHRDLCRAIQEIAKKRGGHIYNNARILNNVDYRSLRCHTLNICENILKRALETYEREILLFPRLCSTPTCREWRQNQLVDCPNCAQVFYCASHPEHLLDSHERWCKSFALYKNLVVTQSRSGRIEPSLSSRIQTKPYILPNSMDEVFKDLCRNYSAMKDDCVYATLTQLATAPLTAYFAAQKSEQKIGESFTIHLAGAELQFEADILDIWETFFLHLTPNLMELTIVFCGPELNAENIPLDIISRIRMCRACRQSCRIVKFDFQCAKLYHEYAKTSAFKKPDLICFFNPGFQHITSYSGVDTWSETLKVASACNCPIIVTSYTENEAPRDLERFQREANTNAKQLTIVHEPQFNTYSSQRPERNFISDEIAPLIFKNFYCFILK